MLQNNNSWYCFLYYFLSSISIHDNHASTPASLCLPSTVRIVQNSNTSVNHLSPHCLQAHKQSGRTKFMPISTLPKSTACGILTQWNSIHPQKGMRFWYMLQHEEALRTPWVSYTSNKRADMEGFHQHEISGDSKHSKAGTEDIWNESGYGKLLFNGWRISLGDDKKKVLEIHCSGRIALWMGLIPPNCAFKELKAVIFVLCTFWRTHIK